MVQLENDQLRVSIKEKGAELTSVFCKRTQLEYMWNGGSEWPKHSPVLFPIVGALKDNEYKFEGKSYTLPRHGFAREKNFQVTDLSSSSASFSIMHDSESLKNYPFEFELSIMYKLEGSALSVSYQVSNAGSQPMYFSIGAHPAFAVPLKDNLDYSDYYFLFNELETAPRWPIVDSGLIAKDPIAFFENTARLDLRKELFHKDAIVLKNLNSSSVELKSDKSPNGLTFEYPGFPYLGIWAAMDANFVCIEPWCGIADREDANQQLTDKEGIIRLETKGMFNRTWKLTVW